MSDKKKKEPIKTLKGNDPRLAKKPEDAQLNSIYKKQGENPDDRNWMQRQLEKTTAHADHFFTTDEDLPLAKHIILLTVIIVWAGLIIWASFATLDEVTRGDGKVIPSSDIQKISSLEGGIVDEYFVREGDEVKAGDLLVRLRDVAAASDLGANEARYLGLLATVTRLQAEAEGKMPEFPEEVINGAPQSVTEEMNAYRANKDKIQGQILVIEQQRSQRREELNELQVRASDLRGQLNLAKEEKAMVEPLVAKGSAPRMELLQLDRQIKERQTELNGVLTAIPRAKAAISEAEARIEDIKSSARAQAQTELSAKLVEMNSIKETLAGLQDRKQRTEIVSPVNGYVKELKVYTVGGVVQPGQDFIEIVPKDDQLLVEARIRPKDIAFIYPDQPAVVKITAYDFSIYGGLDGNVVAISPDAITDEEGNSFYLVRVQTQENSLKRKGEVLPIIPGMVASVDILTGEKTVLEYLLKPFIKTLDNAMNER